MTKSKVSIIDLVHSAGVHLATGALCSGQLECLYMESGKSPLSFSEESVTVCLCSKAGNSIRSSLVQCGLSCDQPLQVQVIHYSSLTYEYVLPQPSPAPSHMPGAYYPH
jgi:hypothetical protein